MATYKDYYDAGFACEGRRDWDGAIDNFTKAISKAQTDQQIGDAYTYRASMYEGKGDSAKAEADLKKAADYSSAAAMDALKTIGINYKPKRKTLHKQTRGYSGSSSSYSPKLNIFLSIFLGLLTGALASSFVKSVARSRDFSYPFWGIIIFVFIAYKSFRNKSKVLSIIFIVLAVLGIIVGVRNGVIRL